MILLGYQLYLSITFIEFLYHPNGVKLAKPKALLQGNHAKAESAFQAAAAR
jgi:hypothetical protein